MPFFSLLSLNQNSDIQLNNAMVFWFQQMSNHKSECLSFFTFTAVDLLKALEMISFSDRIFCWSKALSWWQSTIAWAHLAFYRWIQSIFREIWAWKTNTWHWNGYIITYTLSAVTSNASLSWDKALVRMKFPNESTPYTFIIISFCSCFFRIFTWLNRCGVCPLSFAVSSIAAFHSWHHLLERIGIPSILLFRRAQPFEANVRICSEDQWFY